MNWTERVGIEGAETMIGFLAEHFKVKCPKLRKGRRGYASRGNSGRYRPRNRSICLGPDCQPWVVAHEFAHYLDDMINHRPDIPLWAQKLPRHARPHPVRRTMKEPHSQSFYNNLKRVIAAIGDVDQYPWIKEYAQVFRWAKRDGTVSLDKPLV